MLPVKNETPTRLYNPDLEDFSFTQADDNNKVHSYKLPSQEITTLPHYIAEHGANKLAEKLIWKRGVKTNYQDDKKKILDEVYVQL